MCISCEEVKTTVYCVEYSDAHNALRVATYRVYSEELQDGFMSMDEKKFHAPFEIFTDRQKCEEFAESYAADVGTYVFREVDA